MRWYKSIHKRLSFIQASSNFQQFSLTPQEHFHEWIRISKIRYAQHIVYVRYDKWTVVTDALALNVNMIFRGKKKRKEKKINMDGDGLFNGTGTGTKI